MQRLPLHGQRLTGARAPECLACGACCFSDRADHVRVLDSDYERLGELVESHTALIGSERFMAMHEGRCVALEIGSDGGFSCRIYALRPAVCRDLEPGSAGCADEIALKAERARAACRRSITA